MGGDGARRRHPARLIDADQHQGRRRRGHYTRPVRRAALAWPWLSGVLTSPWDAKSQVQPELQFLETSLAHGDSPFWTPNIYAGWPQIADPQSLIFSPLHLALAALTPTPTFREADLVTFAYLLAGSLAVIMYFRDHGWHAGPGRRRHAADQPAGHP